MPIITNVQPRPQAVDMRGIDPAYVYREAKPAAVNHQAVKPAVIPTGPAMLVLNTPKRDEFAGYSINAAIDEATRVTAPAKPQLAVNAVLGEFAAFRRAGES